MTCKGFVLVGTTATGKTDVVQLLAERHDREILSADSMLVYRGMDVGTAKPSREQRSRARYHGLDLCSPNARFSVGDYLGSCRGIDAARSSRLLVTGGTGLYVKALLNGLSRVPAAPDSIRQQRARLLEEGGVEALQAEVRKRSPALYASITDSSNPRRLLRALDLLDAGETALPQEWLCGEDEEGAVVGIRLPVEVLNVRIEARVSRMYDEGLVDEVRRLKESCDTLSATARQAIGYREVFELLSGDCTAREAMERTVVRTRQLAKRQRTWFRHQLHVEWIDIEASMSPGEVAERVWKRWQEAGPTRLKGLEHDGLQD